MNIIIITYRDQDIELEYSKDEIKWTIQRGDKKYGKGAIIPSKKIEDIIGTVGTIIINAIETKEELDKIKISDSNLTATQLSNIPPTCKPKTSSLEYSSSISWSR